MPMGFKNSPAVFQRLMDQVLKDEIGNKCVVYVDDILIFGKTEEEHEDNLSAVIKKLVKAGLRANEKKCTFKVQELEFLGYKIAKDKILPLSEKVDTIKGYKQPQDVGGLRQFLGLINYYRKFIPNCSTISEPLNKLLRKDSEFIWETDQSQAFEDLKNKLSEKVALSQPDFQKLFILETDASSTGLGAVLLQKNDKDEEEPILFMSMMLTETERRYPITQKEMLGALWSMEYCHYYLYGREFILRTDHKALEAFNTKGIVETNRIEEWMERIQKYSFKVEYRKGESIPHVDALSRQHVHEETVNRIERIISEPEKLKVIEIHERLIHRGAKAVKEKLREEGEEIKEWKVREILKPCMICKMYNPIKTRRYRIIEAFEPGEKVGLDLIEIRKGSYIATAIYYFTRKGFAVYLKNKKSESIVNFLKKITEELKIQTIITDEARKHKFGSKKLDERE